MELISIEEMKESFPFEPFKLKKSLFNYDKDDYENEKKEMNERWLIKDNTEIKRYLEKIHDDMKKTKENMLIYNKLNDNADKLIFTHDISFVLNPLVYYESMGTFGFKLSYCDYSDKNFSWKGIKTEQLIDNMINKIGGIAVKYRYIFPEDINFNSEESYSGKEIKIWCDDFDNKMSDDSKYILENYFSNGKSLGKYSYYFVTKKNNTIKIFRDLKKSPRKN